MALTGVGAVLNQGRLQDRALTGFVLLILVSMAGLFVYGAYDGVLAIQSLAAQSACRTHGLAPVRQPLSTTVACVSDRGRRLDPDAPPVIE
jgi:cation transporter-like permease